MALLDPSQCEWCNVRFPGPWYKPEACFSYTGDEASAYKNEPSQKRKDVIWAMCCRDGEWAKAGDKRGFFCSNQCRTNSSNNGDYGYWHSRGWIW